MPRYIDAEELKHILNNSKYYGTKAGNVFADMITECTTIEERKRGKWNGINADDPRWQRDDESPIFLTCSECYGTVLNGGSADWNFCPYCGVDMREEGSQ